MLPFLGTQPIVQNRKARVTTALELSAFISAYNFQLLFQLRLNSFFFFTYSACHWLTVTHFFCLCFKTFSHPVTHQRPTNYSIYNRLRNSFCLTGATENVLICNTSSFPKEVLSSTWGDSAQLFIWGNTFFLGKWRVFPFCSCCYLLIGLLCNQTSSRLEPNKKR